MQGARAALPNTTHCPFSSVSVVSRETQQLFIFLHISIYQWIYIFFFKRKSLYVLICFHVMSLVYFSYRGSVFSPYGKKSHNLCSFLVIVMSYLIAKGSFQFDDVVVDVILQCNFIIFLCCNKYLPPPPSSSYFILSYLYTSFENLPQQSFILVFQFLNFVR